MENQKFQRLPAEILYQKELDTLIANEQYPVPPGWNMSPRSVFTYILSLIHISEPTRQAEISYAVFCLKKKKKKKAGTRMQPSEG